MSSPECTLSTDPSDRHAQISALSIAQPNPELEPLTEQGAMTVKHPEEPPTSEPENLKEQEDAPIISPVDEQGHTDHATQRDNRSLRSIASRTTVCYTLLSAILSNFHGRAKIHHMCGQRDRGSLILLRMNGVKKILAPLLVEVFARPNLMLRPRNHYERRLLSIIRWV